MPGSRSDTLDALQETARDITGEAVLALQQTDSDEEDVQAHSVGVGSTTSVAMSCCNCSY